MKQLTITQLQELMVDNTKTADIDFIDVRSQKEYRSKNIDGFNNVLVDDFVQGKGEADRDKKIIVMCHSGARSLAACKALIKHGFTNVYNLDGGLMSWERAKYPIASSSQQHVTILQQVQVIVGGGVLAFSLGSYFINPQLIWGAAFFGSGLLFAGLTGTCAMARMLEKLPWNS
jgi:rhodanese-related sulfurtransferase